MNGVEQCHRLRCLVGLQRADHVQCEPLIALPQRRPFAGGFLYAILAEHPLAGIDDGRDHRGLEGFRDRHKGHPLRRLPGVAASGRDCFPNGREGRNGVIQVWQHGDR